MRRKLIAGSLAAMTLLSVPVYASGAEGGESKYQTTYGSKQFDGVTISVELFDRSNAPEGSTILENRWTKYAQDAMAEVGINLEFVAVPRGDEVSKMQTMDGIFTNLKRMFQSGNILSKLIYIIVGLFILIRLASVLFMLFNVQGVPFLQYLQLPASPELLLFRPWTLFTYMFTHFDFLHILFNMLWLYWFGGLFLNFFSERQLGGLYILGGLAGAVLFVLAYNIFPYFQNVASFSYLMGASASVMAIVFAVSFYRKDLEINLFLIGRIKLIYLAIFTLVIDLLAMTSDNAGGHIAHIGGALFGMWFASRIRNGKDLTAPMNRLIDWFVNLGKRKPKMRVTYKRNETDYEYNARKHQESVDLDTILDKLKRSGYESLSAEEKRRLFDASKK